MDYVLPECLGDSIPSVAPLTSPPYWVEDGDSRESC